MDAAMVDGTAVLTAMFHGMLAMDLWSERRGSNLLDGGAPFYRSYRCADGGFMAVGPLEPKFYAELLDRLGVHGPEWERDPSLWASQHAGLEEVFASRTRAEWTQVFAGSDACVTPVMSLGEAPAHEHLEARGTFVEHEGLLQPAPAPRFSRTAAELSRPPVLPGQHTAEVLAELGLSGYEADELYSAGVAGRRDT